MELEHNEKYLDIYLNRNPKVILRFRGNTYFEFIDYTDCVSTIMLSLVCENIYTKLICDALERAKACS